MSPVSCPLSPRFRALWLVLGVLAACVGACKDLSPVALASPEVVDPTNPASCEACHHAVVKEWRESMHARAHQDHDPIFGAVRALRMKKQGAHIAKGCAKCHSPMSPEAPESAPGRNGVGCATCHATLEVRRGEGREGADALVKAEDGILRGPHDLPAGAAPLHGTGPAASFLTDGQTICLACHDVHSNPQGVAACTTGPEYAVRKGSKTCTECHMPWVEGPSGHVSSRRGHRSHAFLGPHRAWYQGELGVLEDAVALTGQLDDDGLAVRVENLSSHGFPSGFPGRLAILEARGLNADGATIWRSFTSDPRTESPESMFDKVYVDLNGKPTMTPFADRLERDNRLRPDETRTLRFDVPSQVVKAEVALRFYLAPPRLFETLGLEGQPEALPKVIEQLTVLRAPRAPKWTGNARPDALPERNGQREPTRASPR